MTRKKEPQKYLSQGHGFEARNMYIHPKMLTPLDAVLPSPAIPPLQGVSSGGGN